MINLLASGLLLAISAVAPTPSPDCVGATVAPIISTTVCPLPTDPVTLPPAVSVTPPTALPVPPVTITLPPALVVPSKPPVHTPAPVPAPAPAPLPYVPYQPPVYQPPVYQAPTPAQPVPDITTAPVHVQKLPTPAAPATRPAVTGLQLIKHFGTGTAKPQDSVTAPEAVPHRQPPFDNSIAGVIGNTAAQFPDLGWIFLALCGLGVIVLTEKLDRSPKIKPVGRHSTKLK